MSCFFFIVIHTVCFEIIIRVKNFNNDRERSMAFFNAPLLPVMSAFSL